MDKVIRISFTYLVNLRAEENMVYIPQIFVIVLFDLHSESEKLINNTFASNSLIIYRCLSYLLIIKMIENFLNLASDQKLYIYKTLLVNFNESLYKLNKKIC